MSAVVTLRAATLRRGGRSLFHALDLTIAPGSLTLLCGDNGQGKSSLLSVLAGELPLSEGSREAPPRDRIGWSPQQSRLWPELTPLEQLTLLGRLHRSPERDAWGRATQLLRSAGLAEQQHRKAGHLSGGMQRRLGTLLAVMPRPTLALLDEPTAHLDVGAASSMAALLLEARDEGCALVVATHDPDVFVPPHRRPADRVLRIADGRLTELQEPGRLLAEATPTLRVRGSHAALTAVGAIARRDGLEVELEPARLSSLIGIGNGSGGGGETHASAKTNHATGDATGAAS